MAQLRHEPTAQLVEALGGTESGLRRWIGKVACAYDNSLMESFFGSLQIELLDPRRWATCTDLANANFGWIEMSHNPTLHPPRAEPSGPVEFERFPRLRPRRHDHHTEPVRESVESSRGI